MHIVILQYGCILACMELMGFYGCLKVWFFLTSLGKENWIIYGIVILCGLSLYWISPWIIVSDILMMDKWLLRLTG